MQLHHQWLGVADACDAMMAAGARLRVHAQAALARWSRGEAPLSFVAGPASPHEIVADGPLARLVRYRAKGKAHPTPIVIVASPSDCGAATVEWTATATATDVLFGKTSPADGTTKVQSIIEGVK